MDPYSRERSQFFIRIRFAATSVTHHQIYAECKRYGLVQTCGGLGASNLWMSLERSKRSDRLKPKHKMRIGNETVVIEWARDNFPHRPERLKDLESVPDQQSPHNILNALNDDCLRAIFNKLAKKELCAAYNVAHVNKRFRRIVMGIKPKHIIITDDTTDPLWKLEKMLRIFGASIRVADINSRRCADLIIVFLQKYCPNLVTLKSLFKFKNTPNELAALMPRLRSIQLHHQGLGADRLFQPSAHIETIKIQNVSTLPAIHFPKLRCLRVAIGRVAVSHIERFFALNRQIERLALFTIPRHIIPIILAYVPNLTEFATNVDHLHEDDITAICQLKRLNTFGMSYGTGDDGALLRTLLMNGIQIKHLHFTKNGLNPIEFDVTYLTQMISLTSLEIHHLRDNDLLQLVTNCSNLEKIRCKSNQLTLRGVHSALTYATHLKTATLVMWFDEQSHILIDELNAIAELRAAKRIGVRLKICVSAKAKHNIEILINGVRRYCKWMQLCKMRTFDEARV